jgi:hypothetical protein
MANQQYTTQKNVKCDININDGYFCGGMFNICSPTNTHGILLA